LLSAPAGQNLSLAVDNSTLQHAQDLISVLDGGVSSAGPILQLTKLSAKPTRVMSSGQYLMVQLSSSDLTSDVLQFTATPLVSGGHLSGSGVMVFKNNSEFQLTADEGKLVNLGLGSMSKLEGDAKITIYSDSNATELITFNATRTPFDITSPTRDLLVVAAGFTKDAQVKFFSQAANETCARSFIGTAEQEIQVPKGCESTATWIIRPQVPSRTAIYVKVVPNGATDATITKLNGDQGKVVQLNGTSEPLMFTLQAWFGAKVTASDKNLRISYTTSISQSFNVTHSGKANITVTSPFFPDLYPQNAKFDYVVAADSKITYYASFPVVDLLPGYNLAFKGETHQITGSKPIPDMLLSGGDLQEITLTPAEGPPIVKSAHGFHAEFETTFESFHKILADKDAKEDKFNMSAKCANSLCVYIIEKARPANVNQSVSFNITLTVPKNSTLKEYDLRIFDGDSILRSPETVSSAVLIKGGTFSFQSNRITIRYKGNMNLTVNYTTTDCSYEKNNLCMAHDDQPQLCMPTTWRCNLILECKDGSDELYCPDAKPPGPTPDPTPAPSSGYKTAFWLCMPIFILLGVVIHKFTPVVMQRLRDSRYQQFHDLGGHWGGNSTAGVGTEGGATNPQMMFRADDPNV